MERCVVHGSFSIEDIEPAQARLVCEKYEQFLQFCGQFIRSGSTAEIGSVTRRQVVDITYDFNTNDPYLRQRKG